MSTPAARNYLKLKSRQRLEVVSVYWPGATVFGKANEFQVAATYINDAAPNTDQIYSFRDHLGVGGIPFRYLALTGDPVTEQANADYVWNKYADGGVTCLAFDWYQKASLITSGLPDDRQYLQVSFDRYMDSPVKNRLKFCLVLISGQAAYDVNTTSTKLPPLAPTGGTWLNFAPNFVPYWQTLVADPQYLRMPDGRPVVFLFNSAGPTWDATRVAQLRAALDGGGYLLGNNITMVTALGLDAVFFYGPNATGFGATHTPYSTQITKDKSNWLVTFGGTKCIPVVTVANNGQPRLPNANWVDRPVYDQIETHSAQGLDYARMNRSYCPLGGIFFHAAEEPDEEGDVAPTEQNIEFSPTTGQSLYLAALKRNREGSPPSVYYNQYHPFWLNARIATSGAGWSLVQSLFNAGGGSALEWSEARTSGAGQSKTFTSQANCTRLILRGSLAPALGSGLATLDAGAPVAVVQTAVGTSRGQTLFDSGPLAAGVHTLKYEQSAGTIGISAFLEEVTR